MKTTPWLRGTAALGTLLLISMTSSCAGPGDVETAGVGAQNWTEEEQWAWYEATQGSRLMPLDWFKALERPGSDQPFADQDWLAEQFRFLRSRPDRDEPLPVGFAVDDTDDDKLRFPDGKPSVSKLRWYAGQDSKQKWVGLNCAACHTAEITHNGTPMRIDGGPGMTDFQSFIEAVDIALVETRDDPAKAERFAEGVLRKHTPDNQPIKPEARDKLMAELRKLIDWQQQTDKMNETPLRYGFARVDAFGHIYNKIALFVKSSVQPTPNPSDAPVSYPFLWDTHRQDKLQWNGIAENKRLNLGAGGYLDYGALGRNAGEVIGVFGDVVVREDPGLKGFASSVQASNLNRMETQLSRLRSPRWPEMFPAPDASVLAAGQSLFADKCQSCHKIVPGDAPIKVTMVPLFAPTAEKNRTDPWMACNAFTYETFSGLLEGSKSNLVDGATIGPVAQNADLLTTTVKNALVGKKGQLIAEAATTFVGIHRPPRVVGAEAIGGPKQQRLEICQNTRHELLAYKARPLNGIWATAPYLHNGSVPTLYDLLLPAAQRPASFRVGTREYDPVKVGYRTDASAPGNGFEFRTNDPNGGNSNAGHDYGSASMTEVDRRALVEYLKTL